MPEDVGFPNGFRNREKDFGPRLVLIFALVPGSF
jgi:hypothetical protein